MAAEFYVTIEGTKQGALTGESVHPPARGSPGRSRVPLQRRPPARRRQRDGHREADPPAHLVREGVGGRVAAALPGPGDQRDDQVGGLRVRAHRRRGEEIVFHRITVTSARVTEIEQFIDDSALSQNSTGLEKISLVFQRIEIENLEGKTSAIDDFGKACETEGHESQPIRHHRGRGARHSRAGPGVPARHRRRGRRRSSHTPPARGPSGSAPTRCEGIHGHG